MSTLTDEENFSSSTFVLLPENNQHLAALCGRHDEHLKQIEPYLGVEINNRGFQFEVIGNSASLPSVEGVIKQLYQLAGDGQLTPAQVHLLLQEQGIEQDQTANKENTELEDESKVVSVRTHRVSVKGRGYNQNVYLNNILTHDINFGVGPAGTGKTYLAVACAVEALEQERVRRLILVRPAVEAGERLGFLPGDLAQKIDPYLRPMYDALYEMMGFERVAKYIERNVIEVAPLAYMRGRTLNESFIILDEAQNTTVEQMKMFLTRIGFGSTAVITGDVTQIDLPKSELSGLRHAVKVVKDVKGISINFFKSRDVVRHPLVQKIVEAYAALDTDDDH
ncbi:MAG: PhoH family protein [Gammaproteobacteria bacterium]|nr:PhoH family protein [Gammaproteobacteria bacterium]